MAKRSLSALTAALTAVWTLLPATTSFAHCPGVSGPPAYLTTFFAPIQGGGIKLGLELVASELTSPLKATVAPGLPNHLFVVDQVGIVWAVDLTTGSKEVFLDVSALLVTLGVLGPNTFDERGLLGLAFHPDYQTNGRLYTYTSRPNAGPPTFPTTMPGGPGTGDHQNVVTEWIANDPADPSAGVDLASERELMRVDWPQFNHDGGDLAFGPDGYLYISMGDGGGADDADGQLFIVADGLGTQAPIVGHQVNGNAQKLNTPLGKILRIDVDGGNSANGAYGIPADNPFVTTPGALDEIFAFGFRNPYRFSFDTGTGALLVGDVGQNDIEEVDRVVKGGNYGWNAKEGTLFFHINGNDEGFASRVNNGRATAAMIDPIAQYDTHGEGHSVIGGFVYHGDRIPQLRGRYVFGEFSRVFNFPSGPHNFGRLLYLQQKKTSKDKLLNVQEFKGFAEAIAAVGLSSGSAACGGLFPPTLAVLGMGQDVSGEIYTMGNINGVPFGTNGVLLRIAPAKNKK